MEHTPELIFIYDSYLVNKELYLRHISESPLVKTRLTGKTYTLKVGTGP